MTETGLTVGRCNIQVEKEDEGKGSAVVRPRSSLKGDMEERGFGFEHIPVLWTQKGYPGPV